MGEMSQETGPSVLVVFRQQSRALSKVQTALVRFRLHIWPTVSTYLCKSLSLQRGWFKFTFCCPGKVQTVTYLCSSNVQSACLAYSFHLSLPS